jgi:hypothetical protein
MATFVNDLRLKEIATGDESGTWGTSTNTNLALIADAFSLGTKQMAADANETFTMPDATADGTRSLYLKITSAVSLTATRTVTLAPNTVSKVWIIENATSGSQSITIAQGSGATVTVPTGQKVMIVTDGAGGGAAVTNANPTAAAVNLATGVTGTLPIANGGTGTTSTTFANLTTNVTGTLPIANGGTGTTSTTFANLTTNVTGTLPVANGGTGITSFGTGVATALGGNINTSGGYVTQSGTLAASAIVLGGGSAAAVTSTTTGTGVVTAVGTAVNTSGGLVTQSGTLDANKVLLGGGSAAAVTSTSLLGTAAAVTSGTYIQAIGYADTVVALGNTGTAINLDVVSGGVFSATLTGSATITLRFPVATGASSFTLILSNDATAGRTVAWAGGSFKFPGGAATLSRTTTANATDIWVFFTPDGGTTYFGNIAMKNLIA